MYGDVSGAGVRRVGAELIGRWFASDHGGPDASGRKTEARGALWKRSDSGVAASGHLTVLRPVAT